MAGASFLTALPHPHRRRTDTDVVERTGVPGCVQGGCIGVCTGGVQGLEPGFRLFSVLYVLRVLCFTLLTPFPYFILFCVPSPLRAAVSWQARSTLRPRYARSKYTPLHALRLIKLPFDLVNVKHK